MKESTKWMSCKYPEDMVKRSEQLSGFFGISRSELLRLALGEYLTRRSSSLSTSASGLKKSSVETKSRNGK